MADENKFGPGALIENGSDDLEIELEEEEAEQPWLVTFADITMLLLVFFVLLYSMSNIDERRFNDSFISVQKALMGKDTSPALMKVNQTDSGAILDQIQMSRQLIKEQGEIFSDFTFFQNTKGLEGVIGGTFDKGVITLRLPAGVLFAPGSARVDEEGQQLLLQLRDFFIRHPDQTINIRGFTDDIPPGPGSRYRDNWELSAMRAVNVLRTLMAYDIDPGRMTATGLADMEPLYPNTSPENRARNRRIEIQLERRVGG